MFKPALKPMHALISKYSRQLSIKKLTIIGFAAVLIPLFITIIYGASRIGVLSEQSANSIERVSAFIHTVRQLNASLDKSQRVASQYAVLGSPELYQRYVQEREKQEAVWLNRHGYMFATEPLKDASEQLLSSLSTIDNLLEQHNNLGSTPESKTLTLESLTPLFQQAELDKQKIADAIELVINQQVFSLDKQAQQSKYVLLTSLLVIPLSLAIAILFAVQIIRPLRKFTRHIKQIEQGNLDKSIAIQGATEIESIGTALDKMRQQLHSLEQQKSSFIRHISHDLKTPLAAIREGVALLHDHSVGELNDSQQEVTDILSSNVDRLQRLIEDLLSFNVVLDSLSLQQAQKINVNNVFNECVNAHQLDITRKQLHIKRNNLDVFVYCHPKQLSVVLDNLLSNAIKYSPQNGTIKIQCSYDNHKLVLSIKDQGPGIPKEIRDKVFDAFVQGPAPENYKVKSSGLGLTIVQEITSRMQGNIALVASEQGAHFVLTLPTAH